MGTPGKYDVEAVRKKLQEKKGSRFKDPNEFRCPTAKDGEPGKYRFFVLPPLKKGEKCADGVATRTMDLFYVQNGSHWFNNRPHGCPRVHDEMDCAACQNGFDLMGETDDKERRKEIAKQWLPRTNYAVNIYFPKDGTNPDDVAGKVMWMNAPKQVYDVWEGCLMAQNAGDPADPQAFGVFYDEEDAYLFQLVAKKKNKYNEYTTSKFLANVKKPLASSGGKPLADRIQQILDSRFDLYTKFPPRDQAAMATLVKQLMSGEPAEATDPGAGFDEDAAAPAAPKPAATPPKQTAGRPKATATPPKVTTPAPVVTEAEDPTPPVTPEAEAPAEDPITPPAADAKGEKPKADVEDAELQSLLDELDDGK